MLLPAKGPHLSDEPHFLMFKVIFFDKQTFI